MLGKTIGQALAELAPKEKNGDLLPSLGGLFTGVDRFARRVPWYVWVVVAVIAVVKWRKK